MRARTRDEMEPFGSTFWFNFGRTCWYMNKAEALPGDQEFAVALYDRKYKYLKWSYICFLTGLAVAAMEIVVVTVLGTS